jgi:hypothetical protein
MPPRKSVKKVEIADESVLDLKSKTQRKKAPIVSEDPSEISFNISHIRDKDMERDFEVEESSVDVETEAIIERTARSPKFDTEQLNERMESFAEKLERAVIKVSPSESDREAKEAAEPKELIKVKFEKFVQLVATKDFLEVLERNRDENIVLSSNLLTELASATEDRSEKKSPVVFIVGLAIGVIITYLLINN